MKRSVALLFGASLALAAGNANSCETLQDAMTEFEGVKNAYVAKAPTMKPEMFQLWAKHIQAFGDAMGKQDYAAACATLAAASDELGLGVGGETTTAVPPPPPTPTEDGDNTPPPPPTTADSGTPPPPPTPLTEDGAGGAEDVAGTWKECPRGRCRD